MSASDIVTAAVANEVATDDMVARARRAPHDRLPFDPIDIAREKWAESGWTSAADGMAAVTSVMRAHQIMLALVETRLSPFKLSFARYEILMLLLFSRSGALPISVLGRRLQVHPTSVTGPLDRLERDGYASRRPHPSDRRTTLAELTPAGRSTALSATEVLNREVFADLGTNTTTTRGIYDVLREFRVGQGDFRDEVAATT
ncbi:MAG TPA: MarR family transcriptional regulator [Jatrophihabitans sp.]